MWGGGSGDGGRALDLKTISAQQIRMWQEPQFLDWTVKANQENDYSELLSSFSRSLLIMVLRKTSEPPKKIIIILPMRVCK